MAFLNFSIDLLAAGSQSARCQFKVYMSSVLSLKELLNLIALKPLSMAKTQLLI